MRKQGPASCLIQHSLETFTVKRIAVNTLGLDLAPTQPHQQWLRVAWPTLPEPHIRTCRLKLTRTGYAEEAKQFPNPIQLARTRGHPPELHHLRDRETPCPIDMRRKRGIVVATGQILSVQALSVGPERGGHAQYLLKLQSCLGGDARLALDDLVDGLLGRPVRQASSD